jgi:hypothetical protein
MERSSCEEELIVPNGTPLSIACRHACAMAEQLDRNVWFDYNGERIVARPGLDPESLELSYLSRCNRAKHENL